MAKENLVEVMQFCQSHEINESFLLQLQEIGLVEITTIEEKTFFPAEQLSSLEWIIRLNVDLEINIEGIDAIRHLVDRMRDLENENRQLKGKIRFFESLESGKWDAG